MRKVLSLVLVLALVLGSFSMAFAAAPADVVGTPSETAVSVLMDLGVVSGYTDGTYKPAGIVTRAEMAKLIVAALGLSDYATGTTTKYPDMAGATWAQGYVSYATGLGVVSGYPDGTFKPNAPVSYTEAAAMIVRALGYNEASLLPATWPANFVVKAKALGILDDIDSTVGGANRGDVAIMLYAALGAKIGTYTVDNGWKANDPADTMLDRLGAVAFDAEIITGEEASAINLRAYVGASASVYRDGPDASGTGEDDIIAIKAVDSTFFTGKFADNQNGPTITATSKFTTSDDVDYTMKATTSVSAIHFFLNGEEIADYDVSKDDSVTIAAELSGTKIDPLYSILKWVITDSSLATTTSLKKITADTPTLGGETFLLTDADAIDLNSFELVGVKSLADIKVDNVVYVYTGSNDTNHDITKIAVGTTVVAGEITKISSSGDYTIGGKVYSSFRATAPTGDPVGAGDTVKAYLDAYGDVYKFVVTDATADNFAIALEDAPGLTGLNGYAAAVKLFLADGTDKVFKVDDATDLGLIEDGSGDSLVFTTDPSINIVKYGVDADGVIDSIKVFNAANAQSGYTFTNWTDDTTDVTDKGTYNGKAIASDAIVFTTETLSPASLTVDDWSVTTADKIKGTDNAAAWYVVDTDTNKIVVMVLASGTSTTTDVGVLTDWAELPSAADYDYEVSALISGLSVTKEAATIVKNLADDTANNKKFYELAYYSTGAFKTATPVVTGVTQIAGEATGVTYTLKNLAAGDTSDVAYMDGSLGTWTLDAAPIVYVYDVDAYVAGTLDDVDGTYQTTIVDVDGDDVYEYILVNVDLVD